MNGGFVAFADLVPYSTHIFLMDNGLFYFCLFKGRSIFSIFLITREKSKYI